MMDDHPNMFLDTAVINITDHLIDTAYTVEPSRLLDYEDRICFGSDWPLIHYDYQTALDSVKRFGFPPEIYRKVMFDNALRFLKVNPETVQPTRH
jgi:predicted TIM-barrel fold metal-dependent hydrolase